MMFRTDRHDETNKSLFAKLRIRHKNVMVTGLVTRCVGTSKTHY